jgi:hypothetical protein
MSMTQEPRRFGASAAAEMIDGGDPHGRRAVVTGAGRLWAVSEGLVR